MFRALLSKEWTQLRTLRWVASGLGLLLPLFLLAGAEFATQGWLPFGSLSGYSTRTVLMEALPAVLAGLWGLVALLVTGQAFSGDRAAGTEAFLLERPVARSAAWRARLVAAVGTLLAAVAFHILTWVVLSSVVLSPDAAAWARAWTIMSLGGSLAACLGLLGGTAAAALVASPMHAAMLGLVLAALPAGLATFLGGRFPMVTLGEIPLGFPLPVLLLVGYVVAAFRADCRGEPAGRGRLVRGIVPLAIFLVSVPVVFAVTAPLALRWSAAHQLLHLYTPERGGKAVVLGESWRRSSGWILDVERGRKIRFLPPHVFDAVWHPDGTRLAVLDMTSGLGSARFGLKVEVFDADAEPAGPGIELDLTREWVEDLRWSGDLLIGKVSEGSRGSAVLIIEPETARTRRVALDQESWTWSFVGPTDSGSIFVHRMVSPPEKRYALHRLDTAAGRLDPEPLLTEEELPTFASKSLSPSGRYWLRRIPKERIWVVDLESGSEHPLPECIWADWMEDDRLLGIDVVNGRRVTWIGTPGVARERLREWEDSTVILTPSPDRRRALIQVWDWTDPRAEDGPDRRWTPTGQWIEHSNSIRELWIYTPGDPGGFTDRSAWLADQPARAQTIQWAGPDRVAMTGPGLLALRAVDGDRWSYVIGDP